MAHIERDNHDTSLTQLDDTKLSCRVFSISSSEDFQLQVCLPNVFADRAGPFIVNLVRVLRLHQMSWELH